MRTSVEKFWVIRNSDGQRGWLVDASDPDRPVMPPWPDDKTGVRLDRPDQVLVKSYNQGRKWSQEWKPTATASPISDTAKAKIAFAALRELANALGDYQAGRTEFGKLTDRKRVAFLERGPAGLDDSAADDVRQELYDAIMEVLNRDSAD